ncbi:MAG TPA: hypothetical protein VLE89_04460 [Chlamydiales bacterium]|nr:hypothetical protein [Chlamydiales bacterium]
MKITIAEQLRPFSHTPGAACVIPGSGWEIEAFPTLLRFGNRIEAVFKLTGPVKGFTLQQDLEKNCVWVFGEAKEGYYRFRIEASDSGIELWAEKTPEKGIECNGKIIRRKEKVYFPAEVPFVHCKPEERLSLGNHKAQDWDLVQKRGDLKELAPVLFAVGQKIPYVVPGPLKGTARLLKLPEDRNLAAEALENFFKAAFTKMLVPRLIDDQYQGLVPEEEVGGDPLFLLQEGMKMIRALFFAQNDRRLKLLGFLPIPFDSGRMIRVKAVGVGELDFEWSKKQLRRLIIRADTTGDVVLELPKGIDSFRVKRSLREKGKKQKNPLFLEAGKTVFVDRFQ